MQDQEQINEGNGKIFSLALNLFETRATFLKMVKAQENISNSFSLCSIFEKQ